MSFFRPFKFSILFLLAIAAGACAKTPAPAPAPVDPPSKESQNLHRQITGSLTELTRKIGESEFADDCDRQELPQRLAVVQALDAHQEEIEAAARSLTGSPHYRYIPFGPMKAQEPIQLEGGPALAAESESPKWKELESSWTLLHRSFEGLRNDPVDPRWVELDGRVRAVLFDDDRRVLGAWNPYLDRHAGAALEAAITEVEGCAAENDCFSLARSPATEKFLKANPFYEYFVFKLGRATDPIEKRRLIQRLLKRLRYDFHWYEFNPNATLRQESPGLFRLPLAAGPFEGFEVGFAQRMDSFWRDSSHRVEIHWVRKIDLPEVFGLALGSEVGGRSRVYHDRKEVWLFPLEFVRAIAHEFGHVLGLPDRYYAVWHPETCSYREQQNTADLMSNVETGAVLPEDWEELGRRYPLRAE